MSTTTTPTTPTGPELAPELRPPRIPRKAPVSVLHVSTVQTNGGAHHSRNVWFVNDLRGRLVETIDTDTDDRGEAMAARWPWFSSYQVARFGLPYDSHTWAVAHVHVTPAELRRMLKWEADPERANLRALGDRCARHSAIREAVNHVQVNTYRGKVDHDGQDVGAWVYHRPTDPTGPAVARALDGLVSRGELARLAVQTTTDGLVFAGYYQATDTTPAYA